MNNLNTRKLVLDPKVYDTIVESRIQILEKIAGTLDVEEVLKRIVEAAVELSGADEGTLLLIDNDTGELYMRAAKGFGEHYASTFRQQVSDDSIAGQVIITGRPVLISPETSKEALIKVDTGYLAHSVLNLPIKQESQVHGVLAVYNSATRIPFTHEHLLLLTPLASYAAIAIENAQRYEVASALLGDTYTLFDIAGLFTQTHDLDELLNVIVDVTLKRIEPADRVVIHMLNEETNRLEYQVRLPALEQSQTKVSGFAVGEGVAGRVLQDNRPICINDVENHPEFISRGVTFGSLMVAPISWRSHCIGTISVASLHKNAFRHRNERFLTSLANLAAIAIENANLYSQQRQLYKESQERLEIVQHRNKELSSLRDILGAMQSTLSLPEVLARVTEGVVQGLNYRLVMLATIDEANQQLTIKELAIEPEFDPANLLERAEEIAGRPLVESSISLKTKAANIGIEVSFERQAKVTRNLHDVFNPLIEEKRCMAIQDLFQLQAMAVLPIRSDNRLSGVLYAGTPRTKIDEEHLEALQAFANQAALAIRNARQFEYMHERLRRRMGELQGLQNIDRLISSTPDLEKMLQSILEVSLKLVNAECGNIALMDEETHSLIPQVSSPKNSIALEKYRLGLSGWVARVRKTARIRNIPQTQWLNTYKAIDIRSELAAPILVGEELVGVINMGSTKIDIFTQEDESLLDILASQTAVAIQTARYYQELEKTRQRSFEAERIAAMGDIASNMVHNINNSIGAIRVLVQQIRFKLTRESLKPEFLDKKLDGIEKSAEKTLELARSIRDPFQSLATEPTDVNACIQAALRDFYPYPSTLDVQLDLARNLPPVMATRQLEEVFKNLFSNAIQSMKGVGRLHIISRRTGKLVTVGVTDTGPGLSTNMTETSVFKLGASSKSDGLGYGLWWCKIYLNRVDGTIHLDQNYKSGCRFIVRLPFKQTP